MEVNPHKTDCILVDPDDVKVICTALKSAADWIEIHRAEYEAIISQLEIRHETSPFAQIELVNPESLYVLGGLMLVADEGDADAAALLDKHQRSIHLANS